MGTNYYAVVDPCPTCGRGERLHIGKSSGGWCFSLHVDEHRKSLEDWEFFCDQPGVHVENEYGERIDVADLIEVIADRGSEKLGGHGDLTPDWFRVNHAEPGPRGLVRHRIDGSHCIGHGEGTWDLCQGEFS